MDMKEKAVHLLRALTSAHGPSGYEDSVRRVFREELKGRPIRTDRAGNIICEKKGSADVPKIMLAAHMDEVGLVVQSITKAGLLKLLPLGGWWSHTLLAQRVSIRTRSGSDVIGVIGAKPPHFLAEAEREKLMKIEDMFVDIGAKSADDVRNRFGIDVGDSIVPYSPFSTMNDPDLLLSKGFDDRAGLAVVIHAVQMLDQLPHPNLVYAAGTIQEEVGMRGAQTAVFGINPDAAIVLEGTPADDMPGVPEDERQGVLGGGVQIRIMDASAIMTRAFVQLAADLAKAKGIRYQTAVRRSGGTDARPIHLNGTGVPTIVLGVPARYIHTHNALVHLGDYLSALELTVQLLQKLDYETVESLTAYND